MDKSCDTQLLSPRQVLFLRPEASPFRAQVMQALASPQFIVAQVADLPGALQLLAARKIEVLLFEPEAGVTRSRAVLARLKQADPDMAILVVAPRLSLVATVAAMQAEGASEPDFDFIGTPLGGPELVRSLERARELRYLRRAEERRQRAEARMSAVVQAVPYAVVSLDDRGVIHDWNPGAQAIFGWSSAQAVGQSFWEIAFSADPAPLRAAFATLEGAPGPARLEVCARRRDGREFPAVVALARVSLAERAMFCAVLEDVGDARRREIELRLAQKLEAVGRLASGLAHEINTPCQVIGLQVHFAREALDELRRVLQLYTRLRDAVAGDDRVAPLLAEIAQLEESVELDYLLEHAPAALASVDEGTGRIASLVAAMKHFAQPDVGGPQIIDLNRALESTLTVVQHQVKAVGEVEKRFGEVPTITGLPGDLNQALLGIVVNAIQALEDRKPGREGPGRIIVETRAVADGTAVEVAISDNGPGIPASIQGRIFDPFFTTREVGRGAGQGLSVARSIIVDRHGGTLTFDSELDVGTTFHVHLPVAGPIVTAG